MKKLTIGFAGTPDFAAECLELLQTNSQLALEISFVLTQDDKPVGRKQILTASPVKVIAQKHTIPVIHAFDEARPLLDAVDLVLVFAYGAFIPANLLAIPRLGWWNIHPSLLPLYRGPSPTAYPLMMGDAQTGVTFIKLDEKMDHGPVIAQQKISLSSTIPRNELEQALPQLAADLFLSIAAQLNTDTKLDMTEQDHEKATITKLMKREHGFIPLNLLQTAISTEGILSENELPSLIKEYIQKYPGTTSREWRSSSVIYNYWRALHPWPGIWTEKDGKRIKIIACELKEENLHITAIQLDGRPVSDNKEQISQLFSRSS